ncbi:MAG: hypothetical protein IT330_08200 [Anaerolineae bacterium]|nr:hypothetical protein [Anaerolineae bacterium]
MSEKRAQPKKTWTTPQLIVHGSVEKITETCNVKTFGLYDGWVWTNGAPLKTACS